MWNESRLCGSWRRTPGRNEEVAPPPPHASMCKSFKINRYMEKGTFVLVRAGGAGVHFGKYAGKSELGLHLTDAKRLWSWTGALSLSEIASKGVDIKGSKISVSVEEIVLPTVLEIIKVSPKSNLNAA